MLLAPVASLFNWPQLGMWIQDEQPNAAIAHLRRSLELETRAPTVRSAIYVMGRIYQT
jgi:hypothetical protein